MLDEGTGKVMKYTPFIISYVEIGAAVFDFEEGVQLAVYLNAAHESAESAAKQDRLKMLPLAKSLNDLIQVVNTAVAISSLTVDMYSIVQVTAAHWTEQKILQSKKSGWAF